MCQAQQHGGPKELPESKVSKLKTDSLALLLQEVCKIEQDMLMTEFWHWYVRAGQNVTLETIKALSVDDYATKAFPVGCSPQMAARRKLTCHLLQLLQNWCPSAALNLQLSEAMLAVISFAHCWVAHEEGWPNQLSLLTCAPK